MCKADLIRSHPDLKEYFDLDNIPLLPCIWTAGGEIPSAVRHLYVSHSAWELVCFAHFHPGILKFSTGVAFAALGTNPRRQQVQGLTRKFPGARMHAVFSDDTIGKVCDCLLALWLKGRSGKLRVKDERVEVYEKGRMYGFPEVLFSLHKFQKAAGLRSGIHTHKPRRGYTTWAEMFRASCAPGTC